MKSDTFWRKLGLLSLKSQDALQNPQLFSLPKSSPPPPATVRHQPGVRVSSRFRCSRTRVELSETRRERDWLLRGRGTACPRPLRTWGKISSLSGRFGPSAPAGPRRRRRRRARSGPGPGRVSALPGETHIHFPCATQVVSECDLLCSYK